MFRIELWGNRTLRNSTTKYSGHCAVVIDIIKSYEPYLLPQPMKALLRDASEDVGSLQSETVSCERFMGLGFVGFRF